MKPELVDRSGKRLWSALGASVVVNGLLWRAFGSAIMAHQAPPPQVIEISRVILNRAGKPTPKIVTKKQIQQKVARIHRQIKQSRPVIKPKVPLIEREQPKKPVVRPRIAQNVQQAPDAAKKPLKPPSPNTQGAHNHTLTATQKAAPNSGFVKPGGHSDLGKPIDKQNFGEKTESPKDFVAPTPQPQPTTGPLPVDTPVPPPPDPTPTPLPTPTPTPKPTPTPEPTPTPKPTPKPTPTPRPTPTPKPRGETRDAIPIRQPQPDIPDELKDATFKTFVRVAVAIDAGGHSTPTLRGTSGNAQIDALVLKALSRWKWKPALDNGIPVASSQRFKFEFEVK